MTNQNAPGFASSARSTTSSLQGRCLQLLPPRSRLDEWMGWGLLLLCSVMVGAGVWQMASTTMQAPRCLPVLSAPAG